MAAGRVTVFLSKTYTLPSTVAVMIVPLIFTADGMEFWHPSRMIVKFTNSLLGDDTVNLICDCDGIALSGATSQFEV